MGSVEVHVMVNIMMLDAPFPHIPLSILRMTGIPLRWAARVTVSMLITGVCGMVALSNSLPPGLHFSRLVGQVHYLPLPSCHNREFASTLDIAWAISQNNHQVTKPFPIGSKG